MNIMDACLVGKHRRSVAERIRPANERNVQSGTARIETETERSLILSVIIPVGPNEDAWPPLVLQLTALKKNTEIIIVHTGSSRHSDERYRADGVRHIRSCAGRAQQLNKGAACACGRWLWFLHADSRMTPNVLPTLMHFIQEDTLAIGYFNLRFDQSGFAPTCLNALGANLRSKLLGLPFGDQGFIMRAECFHRLGAYNESVRHGEDHLFVWRARKNGVALRCLPATLISSARRYRQHGWIRTTACNLWLTAIQIAQGCRERT